MKLLIRGAARRCSVVLLLYSLAGCQLFFPPRIDPEYRRIPGNPFDQTHWGWGEAKMARENLERLITVKRDLAYLQSVVTHHGATCSADNERALRCVYRKTYRMAPYGLINETTLRFDVSATGRGSALSSLKVCVTRGDRRPGSHPGDGDRPTTECSE